MVKVFNCSIELEIEHFEHIEHRRFVFNFLKMNSLKKPGKN